MCSLSSVVKRKYSLLRAGVSRLVVESLRPKPIRVRVVSYLSPRPRVCRLFFLGKYVESKYTLPIPITVDFIMMLADTSNFSRFRQSYRRGIPEAECAFISTPPHVLPPPTSWCAPNPDSHLHTPPEPETWNLQSERRNLKPKT